MQVKVHQFYNGREPFIRIVEVPDTPDVIAAGEMTLLNHVYQNGQNEVQPQQCPSVSVGDIIQLYEGDLATYYVVNNFGFLEIRDLHGFGVYDVHHHTQKPSPRESETMLDMLQALRRRQREIPLSPGDLSIRQIAELMEGMLKRHDIKYKPFDPNATEAYEVR